MHVLVLGASGFIGSHLVRALQNRGHEVTCATRHAADLSRDHDPALWMPWVKGMDAVVNTVGIFQERQGQTFEAVHVQGPLALFEACAAAGVRRVVQISALGADAEANTNYHLSKKAADDALMRLVPAATVVQPSLVFGDDGESARWFLMLATLPVVAVPSGAQRVQPVHIDDVTLALVRLLEDGKHAGERVAFAGPQALTLRAYLSCLRHALGLRPAVVVPIPGALVSIAAYVGSLTQSGLLSRESWQMLRRGNTGPADALQALAGRPLRTASDFVDANRREGALALARLGWCLPLLRVSVALVWIVTGIVSVWAFPVPDSLALLERAGVPHALGPLMLYGAAGLDLLLGLAVLTWPGRRLWLSQMALMLFYTVVITWRLPEFWAHPYGPVLKNLPMFAALLMLYTFEDRR